MAKYLLIESRDPFEAAGAHDSIDLAVDLVRAGHTVTLFLVQNGVLPARPCRFSAALSTAVDAGVEVLADDFSLRERGIAARKLADGIQAAPLSVVIDQMVDGRRTIWH